MMQLLRTSCLKNHFVFTALVATAALHFCPSDSQAQTDPSNFTTVINVPPNLGAGVLIESDTQVNLFGTGMIGSFFSAGANDGSSTNVEVNILSGEVGSQLRAYGGSVINISDGSVGSGFSANEGSKVNIFGGSIGQGIARAGSFKAEDGSVVNISGGNIVDNFSTGFDTTVNISGGTFSSLQTTGDLSVFDGSTINFFGGEFRLDGTLISGLETNGSILPFDLPDDAILSGTFADGTPFAFSSLEGDFFANGTLILNATELPAIGPSTIMLPSSPAPFGVRTGQTLIVEEGGEVAINFNAGKGSTVNVTGGQIGDNFEAVGAQVTLSSGSIGGNFSALDGSTVNIQGGSVGLGSSGRFVIRDSTVNISGGSIPLDLVNNSEVNISGGSVIGARGADYSGSTVNISGGTVVGFKANDGSEINVSGGSAGDAIIENGSTANVSGGFVARIITRGTVNVTGGSIGDGSSAVDGSVVNISDGSIGDDFGAFAGSLVNVSGGSVGSGFSANDGSTVNISGGVIGPFLEPEDPAATGLIAQFGSKVNISGGLVGDFFEARGGSTVNISGGSLGRFFGSSSGSTVIVSGNDFRIDGVLVSKLNTVGNTLPFDLAEGSVLSGTLADGTPFVFSSIDSDTNLNSDFIANGTLTLEATTLPVIGPSVMMVPNDSTPLGIRSGQTLIVKEGGDVTRNFNAGFGSTVNIFGGTIGDNFEAIGAQVTLSNGEIGDSFSVYTGTTVAISGGEVGYFFNALNGSKVNISGGTIGILFSALDGSEVSISGGVIGNGFSAFAGSIVNISGGTVGDYFFIDTNATTNMSGGIIGDGFSVANGGGLNLLGTEFFIDDIAILGLQLGELLTIADRDVILSGTLMDGTAFSFDLDPSFFDPNATLTVTLSVPEPSTALLGMLGLGALLGFSRKR